MDRQMDRIMDRQKNGRTDQLMDGHEIYLRRHAKGNDFPVDFAIFTKALQTNRWIDRPTGRPTDGHTLL